jgi:hypothetical protein
LLRLLSVILMGGAGLAASGDIALAQFQKSDDKLFIGWLDLEAEPDTDFGITEFSAYAIVQQGGENLPVIYVITSNFKGKVYTLGAFRCDKEFVVLNSQVNGMRDIRCVRQDVFGQTTTTTLRFSETGVYVENM